MVKDHRDLVGQPCHGLASLYALRVIGMLGVLHGLHLGHDSHPGQNDQVASDDCYLSLPIHPPRLTPTPYYLVWGYNSIFIFFLYL